MISFVSKDCLVQKLMRGKGPPIKEVGQRSQGRITYWALCSWPVHLSWVPGRQSHALFMVISPMLSVLLHVLENEVGRWSWHSSTKGLCMYRGCFSHPCIGVETQASKWLIRPSLWPDFIYSLSWSLANSICSWVCYSSPQFPHVIHQYPSPTNTHIWE